jgi:hypothetical protein
MILKGILKDLQIPNAFIWVEGKAPDLMGKGRRYYYDLYHPIINAKFAEKNKDIVKIFVMKHKFSAVFDGQNYDNKTRLLFKNEDLYRDMKLRQREKILGMPLNINDFNPGDAFIQYNINRNYFVKVENKEQIDNIIERFKKV